MMGTLERLGDRVLEMLVPKATAKADSSYYVTCSCSQMVRKRKLCHVVGGTSGCTACIYTDVWFC
ncbi:hypothetical protein GCM10022224_017580 [Nonomuraea antimicrobica]|uniref:Uncharacterized protein n=1 Tax=Nonomuraea antimicrobica TaxID=561173 RepID=A0ABP7BCA5_9ACTN